MTGSTPTIDPHLDEVLHDIARDPRARMFVTSPRQLLHGLSGTIPRLSPRQPGLTSAERELLTVHREEVAELLYRSALRRIYDAPEPAVHMNRWIDTDRKVKLLTEDEVSTRARVALVGRVQGEAWSWATSVLREHLVQSTSPRPSATNLALASLRLIPKPTTRICAGIALLEDGELYSALDSFGRVVEQATQPLVRAIAIENRAVVLWKVGVENRAIEEFEWSHRQCPGRPQPLLSLFVMALRIGSREKALAAAEQLAGTVPVEHQLVSDFVEARKAELRMQAGSITSACRELLPAIRDSLHPTARRVADVFE